MDYSLPGSSVHGVTKSRTQLSEFTHSFMFLNADPFPIKDVNNSHSTGIKRGHISKPPIITSVSNCFPALVGCFLSTVLRYSKLKRQATDCSCRVLPDTCFLIVYPSILPFCFSSFIHSSIVYTKHS